MAEDKKGGNVNVEKEPSTFSKMESFVNKNQKILTWVLIGITAVILIIFLYNRFVSNPKNEEAAANMYMAEQYYLIDSFNLALNGDGLDLGFLDIIDQYGSTPTGKLANYYIGMIYLRQRNYEDAITHLKKYNGKDNIIATMALGSIGDAYLELDNNELAIKYYNKAIKNSDNDFTTPMYLHRCAMTYEMMDNYKEAIKLYKEIQKKYPRSIEARDIDKYIARAETALKNK